MTRRLVYEPIGSLVPATRNPKKHDLDALGASVGRFGYVEPVVVDDRTGRLVAGHGRVEQLQRIQATGAEPPPGISVGEDGVWNVPVVRGWESRSDAEAEAYLVASNRTTELGGWDSTELGDLLSDLADSGALDGTGYDTKDLDLLLAEIQQSDGEGPTDPEEEWVGMPDFEQKDLQSQYATTVHFASTEDADRFWRDVLRAGDKPRRSTWWPVHDGWEGSSQRHAYVAADARP